MPVIVHIVRPPRLLSLILSCMIFLYVIGWWSLTTLKWFNKILVDYFKEKFEVDVLGKNLFLMLKQLNFKS